MSNKIVDHVVEGAIALNLIFDIIERTQRKGVTITPANIEAYVAERTALRDQLNQKLGVTEG
jgi:hypothetical protein